MAKKSTKKAKRAKKGSRYVCGVCGLAITVDNICGCVDACDIICCQEAMRPKR